jgi:hypothetical protein
MCPIVIVALAPCQWHRRFDVDDIADMISRCSRSLATMPGLVDRTWSQSWVCHPWCSRGWGTTLRL